MKTQTLVTIPKNIAEFKKIHKGVFEESEEQKLLRLSHEAKNLKKEGRLSVLHSMRDLR